MKWTATISICLSFTSVFTNSTSNYKHHKRKKRQIGMMNQGPQIGQGFGAPMAGGFGMMNQGIAGPPMGGGMRPGMGPGMGPPGLGPPLGTENMGPPGQPGAPMQTFGQSPGPGRNAIFGNDPTIGYNPNNYIQTNIAMGRQPSSFDAVHRWSLELAVEATKCYLLENKQMSNKMAPIYDLAYLAASPYGQIRKIPNIGSVMNNAELVHANNRIVLSDISDPNYLGSVPDGAFKNMPSNIWWLSTGTFRTIKQPGYAGVGISAGQNWGQSEATISLIDVTKPIVNKNAIPKIQQISGWGFSQVEWVDMDGDNNVDCVTIRIKNDQAELIWLRQPTKNKLWDINIIIEDINGQNFKVVKILDDDGTERILIIVAAVYRSELVAVWVDDPDNDWTRVNKIRTKVIDSGANFYSIDVVDLNGDGRADILTSIAGVRGQSGGIVAYEIPTKIENPKAKWRKHILSTDFSSMSSFNRMTPGVSIPFIPTFNSKKPCILVSGQDDGQVYVLKPTSWSVHIWKYETKVILRRPKSIGRPAVQDIDGDGIVEIFVPEGNYIHFLNYIPVYESQGDPSTSMIKTASDKQRFSFFITICSTIIVLLLFGF